MKSATELSRWRSASILVACLTIFIGMSQSVSAQGRLKPDAPNVYELEIEISRGSKLVATPKMTVSFGKSAQMTLVESAGDGSLRIQVTATPAGKTSAGVATVNLRAQVLEELSGAWVVVGEPAIRAAEGRSAAMEVQGGVGALQLRMKASPKFSAKAGDIVLKQCGAIDAPLDRQTVSGVGDPPHCPSLPCPGGCTDCCTTGCTDGSGRELRCCGAIECCDGVCGACCSPPGGGLGC